MEGTDLVAVSAKFATDDLIFLPMIRLNDGGISRVRHRGHLGSNPASPNAL